jgi:hypothetical protein
MKEVCHDFPVSRSATQPDTRFVAVMIGMDAHGFEREFSRLEVHKRTKSQSTAASRRGVFRIRRAMDYAPLRRFLEGNLTRRRHDPCLKPQPWSLISNYVGTLGQTDLTRQANIPA